LITPPLYDTIPCPPIELGLGYCLAVPGVRGPDEGESRIVSLEANGASGIDKLPDSLVPKHSRGKHHQGRALWLAGCAESLTVDAGPRYEYRRLFPYQPHAYEIAPIVAILKNRAALGVTKSHSPQRFDKGTKCPRHALVGGEYVTQSADRIDDCRTTRDPRRYRAINYWFDGAVMD